MLPLQRLDKQLSHLQRQFERMTQDIEFSRICFLNEPKRIAELTYRGIYLVEIKTPGPSRDFTKWRAEFELRWNDPVLKLRFTPGTKNKRMNAHKKLRKWMPLYIGKSERIWHRIEQHINLGLEANLFAMKLRLRPWIDLGEIRLSTINYDDLGIKNYSVLAPALERALRDLHNPVVGQ